MLTDCSIVVGDTEAIKEALDTVDTDSFGPVDCCKVTVERMPGLADEEVTLGWEVFEVATIGIEDCCIAAVVALELAEDWEVRVEDTPEGADCTVTVEINPVELAVASEEAEECALEWKDWVDVDWEGTIEDSLELAVGWEATVVDTLESTVVDTLESVEGTPDGIIELVEDWEEPEAMLEWVDTLELSEDWEVILEGILEIEDDWEETVDTLAEDVDMLDDATEVDTLESVEETLDGILELAEDWEETEDMLEWVDTLELSEDWEVILEGILEIEDDWEETVDTLAEDVDTLDDGEATEVETVDDWEEVVVDMLEKVDDWLETIEGKLELAGDWEDIVEDTIEPVEAVVVVWEITTVEELEAMFGTEVVVDINVDVELWHPTSLL